MVNGCGKLKVWLLPIPEGLGSNPVIGNFYCRKDEKINIKETGNGKVRKYFCPENYLKEEKNHAYFISLIKSRIFCS